MKDAGAAESGSKEGAAEACPALSAQPSVTFVNPGSIGHPKDGSASYAVWDNGTVELQPALRLRRADQGQPLQVEQRQAVSAPSEIINEKGPVAGALRSYGGRRGT